MHTGHVRQTHEPGASRPYSVPVGGFPANAGGSRRSRRGYRSSIASGHANALCAVTAARTDAAGIRS